MTTLYASRFAQHVLNEPKEAGPFLIGMCPHEVRPATRAFRRLGCRVEVDGRKARLRVTPPTPPRRLASAMQLA